MLLVVTTVGLLVHVYSIGYMQGDGGYYRFFAYLPLFVFSMLMLVLADNFLLLFVFWEAVGLCSYLLIGFWYKRRSRGQRGQEGLHRQPGRRPRLRPGDHAHLLDLRGRLLLRRLRPRRRGERGHADRDRPPALPGGLRQERPVPPPRLAAGRDGGPDPGLGPDPRRDDGHRRHLHGGPLLPDLPGVGHGDGRRGPGRGLHRDHGGDDRPGPERHQAGRGLLHPLPARLHVSSRWGPGPGSRPSST